jgi:UrcA family protein
MLARTILSRFLGIRILVSAAGLIAVYLGMPIVALAQQPPVANPSSTAKVSLAGLDLTTSQGIAAARNRLHETARQRCSQAVDDRRPSEQAHFLSCIDVTLISELKQISSSTRADILAHGSAWPIATEVGANSQQRDAANGTSVMVVSIADLDVLSPRDALIARQRIHNAARRVCGQLTSTQDPASIYAGCVNDATAGALRQINETALATN